MPIQFHCPNPDCRKTSAGSEEFVGRRVRCKHCGQSFTATLHGDARTTHDATKASSGTVEMPAAIARFQLRSKLGAGAFGTVYRAYDPQLDREVALKVPNPGTLDNPRRLERFLREAKAVAGLRHPHIVPIFDAGKDGDRFYIASAFIAGKKLSDTIDDDGATLERAARLTRELCEALAYAHEQGIVHRDVKPDNIMLDSKDQLHLMDFGLAARHDEESKLTNDGTVMGTPSYMAPEQAAGQKGEAQSAADQYSAGIVLYELLTGKVPFSGPPAVVIHNQIHTDPDRPTQFRKDIPKDLETICLKAIRKQPDERYPTCQALADDLRRWQEGEPITARHLTSLEKLRRWAKKNKTVAGLVGALALVMVVGTAVSLSFAALAAMQASKAESQKKLAQDAATDAEAKKKLAEDAQAETEIQRQRATTKATEATENLKQSEIERKRANEEKTAADAARKTAEDEKKRADDALIATKAAEKTAYRNLYGARMQLAQNAWKENRLDLIQNLLQDAVKMDADNQLRSFEWTYWDSLINRQSSRIELNHLVQQASVSPDGRWVCLAGDGKKGMGREGTLLDTTTGKIASILDAPTGIPKTLVFNPQGSQLFGAENRRLTAWSVPEGRLLWSIEDDQLLKEGTPRDVLKVLSLAVSLNGERLYSLAGVGYTGTGLEKPRSLRIWSAKDGRLMGEVPLKPGPHLGYIWVGQNGPDDVLYCAGGISANSPRRHTRIRQHSLKTGEPIELMVPAPLVMPKPPAKKDPLAVDPKLATLGYYPSVRGTTFFVQDGDAQEGERDFFFVNANTWKVLHRGKLPPELAKTSFVKFDYDPVHSLAIVADEFQKELIAWDVKTNKVTQRLRGHTEPWVVAASHPKTQTMLTASLTDVRLWSMQADTSGVAKEYRLLESTGHTKAGLVRGDHCQVVGDELVFRYLRENGPVISEDIEVIHWRTGKPGNAANHMFPRPKTVDLNWINSPFLPVYSSDGQWAACVDDKTVLLRELATGREQRIPVPQPVSGLYLSPHGRWLLIGGGIPLKDANPAPILQVWDRTTEKFLDLTSLSLRLFAEAGFNTTWHRYAIDPSERYLYFSGPLAGTPMLDLHEGKLLPNFKKDAANTDFLGKRPSFHPAGSTFATSHAFAIATLATESGTVTKAKLGQDIPSFVQVGVSNEYPKRPLAYSPDGRRLAVISSNRIVNVLDAETLEEVLLLKTPIQLVDIQFSADGRHLVGLPVTSTGYTGNSKTVVRQAVIWGP